MRWEILDAWRDAAAECGIPKIAEFNRGDNFGNAYFQMNQRRGVRWSATKAFLRPVLQRPNLHGASPARTSSACASRRATARCARRASQLVFADGAASRSLRARREVLSRAGAIGSPQILQLSGIGPGALLREHGIARRRTTLPGVGENLHDHLQIRMVYKVRQRGHAESARQQPGSARRRWGSSTLLFKTGPLTMPPSQLGAFAQERSGAAGREHRVARAAAVARQVRRSAARVRRDHAVGLQPAPDEPRPRAHQERRSARRIRRSR